MQVFCEPDKFIHRIHCSELQRNTDLDLVMIQLPTIDLAYGDSTSLNDFSDPNNPPRMLVDMVSIGIYVRDSRKLVHMAGEAGTSSWKSHVLVDSICPDPTASAIFVLSDMRPAKLVVSVPEISFESNSITNDVKPIEVVTESEVLS